MSVTAAFAGGVLDIQVALGGFESVGLFASGDEFFVDQNSNQAQDLGEVTGLIADIGRLQATSPDLAGNFLWRGDFSRAPLNQPGLTGSVVSIEGFQQTQLHATFRADGNFNVESFDRVLLGGRVSINGTANIASDIGAITSDSNANWSFLSSSEFSARGPIQLAQSSTAQFTFAELARFESTHDDVQVGIGSNLELNRLSVLADDAAINAHGSVVLEEVLLSGNLLLRTDGQVTDSLGANLQIQGDLDLAAGSIVLGDDSQDQLIVRGHSQFDGTLNSQLSNIVSIGLRGMADLNRVDIEGHDVILHDDNNLAIARILATGDLELTATGGLTDLAGASMVVSGDARLTATAITLADDFNDVFTVNGSTHFAASGGNVLVGPAGRVELGAITALGNRIEITEYTDMVLESLDAQTATLRSFGAISNTVGANMRVHGEAIFDGSSIALANDSQDMLLVDGAVRLKARTGDIAVGSAGDVRLGDVQAEGNSVLISEDDSLVLELIRADGNLTLISSGALSDIAGATILASGNAALTGSSLVLADNLADQLTLRGNVLLTATANDVTVGPAGLVTLGVVSAAGRDIAISEDAEMVLDQISATDQLLLESSGALSDATGANIQVATDARLSATSILLADRSGDILNIVGQVDLVATRGDVRLGSAGLVTLGTITAAGRNLDLSEDADTVVQSLQATRGLFLNSTGTISDAPGSLIQVAGTASINGTAITLAEQSNDRMIVGGSVRLEAVGGDILIGPAGTVDVGLISTIGNKIEFHEDANSELFAIDASDKFLFTSSGTISDFNGSRVDIRGDATLVAQALLLADNPDDRLTIAGTIDLQIVGDLVIAAAGQVTLGTINATANNIEIFEDSATVLNNVISNNNLRLDSSDSIVNLVAADSAHRSGVQAPIAIITAGSFVHLGNVNFQFLAGEFRANGMLGSASHLQLNHRADHAGGAILDLLNEPTASGAPISNTWIDGSQLADVERQFSYEASFAGQYAFFVTNQTDLQVGPMRGVGDGLHLYLETLGEHDLTIEAAVQIVNTSTIDGGMALIAGDQLTIVATGSLETFAVTGLARDNQRVLVPHFQADAFDGGDGPAGFESTRSVILERALYADTRYAALLAGAQNVYQHVASQFGASGEAGFLAIIRYADGQTQLFDTYGEVFGSFDGSTGSKGPVGTFAGAIPAHAMGDQAAALFARSTPFSDVFLNGEQDLPTSVIYRRSTDFFLFENGGSTDLAVQPFDLNSDADRVLDVLTNAIPPAFSLPNIIETTAPLQTVSIRLIVENNTVGGDIDQEIETKVEFDATRQVIIYRIGFEDKNENGQPEDVELPSREQIVEQHRATQAASSADDDKTSSSENAALSQKLAPGQLDSRWRDVQKDLNPTPETLDAWIDEYRRDPSIVSGAYSIVEEASRTGIEVLRIFSVRDFDEPAQSLSPTGVDKSTSPPELPAPHDEPNEEIPQPQVESSDDDLTQRGSHSESGLFMQPGADDDDTPTHALFLIGGLVWLNKQTASKTSDDWLQSLSPSPVSFDRASRNLRRQPQASRQPETITAASRRDEVAQP